MISVLHVIDTGGPGGAETVFLQTSTRLDPSHFKSIPVVGDEGWLAAQVRDCGFSPHIVPARGSFNSRYLFSLLSLARQNHVNVILTHLYGSAVYASLVGRLLSIPVVSVLHGHTDLAHGGRFASLKAALVRGGSRKVVFVSRRLQDHLQSQLGLHASQCVVIPNGVDTVVFQPSRDQSLREELGLSEEAILVGAIGNIREPKAYDVLLRAVRILATDTSGIHVVIAGDCANSLGAQLRQLSHELGIEERVTFLGLRSDVPRILNSCDAFVLSSHTEGFSIACIEAMACGIPVVATRSGGPEEILQDDAGILVPAGDPQSLAQALARVTASQELAGALTARATERVQREYALTRMLSRYEALLADVARAPRQSTVRHHATD